MAGSTVGGAVGELTFFPLPEAAPLSRDPQLLHVLKGTVGAMTSLPDEDKELHSVASVTKPPSSASKKNRTCIPFRTTATLPPLLSRSCSLARTTDDAALVRTFPLFLLPSGERIPIHGAEAFTIPAGLPPPCVAWASSAARARKSLTTLIEEKLSHTHGREYINGG